MFTIKDALKDRLHRGPLPHVWPLESFYVADFIHLCRLSDVKEDGRNGLKYLHHLKTEYP